jgi:hypothetical protein
MVTSLILVKLKLKFALINPVTPPSGRLFHRLEGGVTLQAKS